MPIPTIPIWAFRNKKITNFHNAWTAAKERYDSMSDEEKAEAAQVGGKWVRDNVLPVVTTVGELIPLTSIPMAAYNTSKAVKKGNYEEAFQHALTPVLTGGVSKGVNLGLKAGEKSIGTAGKALKSADNYVTIQNALRTGKLRFGEPTTYTGIHQSKTPLTKVQFPFQRWDVTTHGADPNGFWLTLADKPNTTGTMASRPYASRWSATSQKPLIQTGEIKGLLGKKNNTRNAIVKYGKKRGADAFEFRGIRDNAIPQTDVVMVTEGTNPQYLGEFTEHTYVSPKTSYKSIFMEEPIMNELKGTSLTRAAYKAPKKRYFIDPANKLVFNLGNSQETLIVTKGQNVIDNAIKSAKRKIKMAETPRSKHYAELQLENLQEQQSKFNQFKIDQKAFKDWLNDVDSGKIDPWEVPAPEYNPRDMYQSLWQIESRLFGEPAPFNIK